MTVDMNEQLAAQLMVIAQQSVEDNQRLAQNTLLAYQKDLFQGAQGETPLIGAGLSYMDRVPVVKGIG